MKAKACRSSSARAKRKKLLERLWEAAEKQIAEVEIRLTRLDGDASAFEEDAKALALLAKLLKELVGIECLMDDASAKKLSARTPIKMPAAEDADAPPRNLDDFRRELARRLDQMRSAWDADRSFDQSQPEGSGEPRG